MSDTGSEIKPEYKWVADKLEKTGLQYKVYNHGIQYNVVDVEGIIQTFYPSTGTIVFHGNNGMRDKRTKIFRDETLETFLSYVTEAGRIKKLFE